MQAGTYLGVVATDVRNGVYVISIGGASAR